MKTFTNATLSEIMTQAWAFVKKNGMTMSEALTLAWRNFKLRVLLTQKIVKFYFQKIDGSVREAYGTLKANICPQTNSNRKPNPTVQVYFDTERESWRCFKKANLICFTI